MNYNQEITFVGGRNTDDDHKSLPPGDFLYALNCHIGITDQGKQTSVENVKGTTVVPFTIPAGVNRCIGAVEDSERNAIIFFMYNSLQQHSIRRYYISTGVVEMIIQDPVLGFRLERRFRIHSANVVEEKLYWVNLALFPCKINMNRAIGYLNRWFFYDNFFGSGGFVGFTAAGLSNPTQPPFQIGDIITVVQNPGFTNSQYNVFALVTGVSGNTITTNIPWVSNTPVNGGYVVFSSSYSIINQEIIDALKRPPSTPPTLQYSTDNTKNINSLKTLLPQVVYRYIYDDYEKSVWSPFSKLALPQDDETFDGEIFGTANKNNALDITINTGPNIVRKVEIGVRFGNLGDVFSVVILDKIELYLQDNINYVWRFLNTTSRIGLDQADVRRPFDNLPQLARSQELLSENVIAYGGCTEGYDNVAVDLELNRVQEQIPFKSEGRDTLPYTILSGGGGFGVDKLNLTIDNLPSEGAVITLVFSLRQQPISPFIFHNFRITYTVTAADAADVNVLIANLINIIQNLNNLPPVPPTSPPMAGPFTVTQQSNTISITYPFNFSSYIVTLWVVDYAAVKVTGHKRGAYHSIGVVYFDRGRRSTTVNVDRLSTPSEIYIPFPSEQNTQITPNYRENIEWKIKSLPPEMATHYALYYSGNKNVLDCTQYIINDIFYQGTARGNVGIDLTFLNTHQDIFKGSRLPAFVFNDDNRSRIRFITAGKSNTTSGLGPLLQDYVDMEILAVDTVNPNIIYTSYFDFSSLLPNEIGVNSLVEIYTPKKDVEENNEPFYEVGELYEIGNPHTPQRYHKAPLQDQDPNNPANTPAVGLQTRGDVYHIARGLNALISFSAQLSSIAGQIVIVVGDFASTVLTMGVIEIIDTPASNGQYQVASAFFDGVANRTNITVSGPITAFNPATQGTVQQPTDSYFPQALVESFSYSDFYESRSYDKGRPNIVDVDARRKYLNIVRHSKRYFQETKINGLNTFYDESVQFADRFGLIQKIIQVGFTLKVLQDQKNTSVYVGRTVMNQPDGTDEIVGTNTILGTTIPHEDDFGTIHPESVRKHDRYVYFYDFLGQRYCRDAANGHVAISDIKMRNYFQDKSNQISQVGPDNVHVISIYDDKFDKLYVTFKYPDSQLGATINDTIAFHENESIKRWRESYSFIPDEYGQFGQTLISFEEVTGQGVLHLHNNNSVYNNFYGTQYTQQIQVVSNVDKMKFKVFSSISVYSNEVWFSPTGGILIPPHSEYPSGMSSRILVNKFKHKQGCWYAEFSRDANTPNANPATIYVNGRRLQGYVLTALLENNKTTYVLLDQIIIKSIPSEKSK